MLHTLTSEPTVILLRSVIPPPRPTSVRWLRPAPRTAGGEREQIAPGVWVVRGRRWLAPSALDTAGELPDPVDAPPVRRRAPRYQPPAWQRRALCARMPPELSDAIFFGEEGMLAPAWRIVAVDAARSICARCPVARKCLTAALSGDDHYVAADAGDEPPARTVRRYGVWGGASGRQRTAMAARIADGVPLDRVVDEFLHCGAGAGAA